MAHLIFARKKNESRRAGQGAKSSMTRHYMIWQPQLLSRLEKVPHPVKDHHIYQQKVVAHDISNATNTSKLQIGPRKRQRSNPSLTKPPERQLL
jgi:hypothetical protein